MPGSERSPLGTVVVSGTLRRPELWLTFDPAKRHPVKTKRTLLDFVKAFPDRRFVPKEHGWLVTGTGPGPDGKFARADFDVDWSLVAGTDLGEVDGLDDLVTPVCKLASDSRTLMVRPRLAGFDETKRRLGPGAVWIKDKQRFHLPVSDLIRDGKVRDGLIVDDDAIDAARRALDSARTDPSMDKHVAVAARAASLGEASQETVRELTDYVGEIPDWFGLDLYPFQRAGALAAAAGHSYLCDSPGLGKSRQALAAAALKHPARTVIVAPPVTLTHWQRETEASELAEHCGTGTEWCPGTGLTSRVSPSIVPMTQRPNRLIVPGLRGPGQIVVVRPGKKEPDFPDAGVVVVADSMIAARASLVDRIAGWVPDVVIVDELHREMTWTAKRTSACMRVAAAAWQLVVGVTGTPMMSSPEQMVSQLEITGHLGPVFGGRGQFLERYCRQDRWGRWLPRKNRLGQLRRVLEDRVWIRRTKKQVLPDLPGKMRRADWVDVDLRDFRAAHDDTLADLENYIDDFAATNDRQPSLDDGDFDPVVSDPLPWLSKMRQAAGLAKIPAAVDKIVEWVTATTEDGDDGPVYTRPLVVWTHHQVVSEAMAASVPEHVGRAESIIGSTPGDERDRIVDDFQAGKIPVLVCSITAAGVGLTLTRSADVMFVETDWTPALVTQAEDRCARIGQKNTVTVTTLIAEGTLDERIQQAQTVKGEMLEAVLAGGDNRVAVDDGEHELATVRELVESMIAVAQQQHAKTRTISA